MKMIFDIFRKKNKEADTVAEPDTEAGTENSIQDEEAVRKLSEKTGRPPDAVEEDMRRTERTIREAAYMADRVIVIADCGVYLDGTPREVFSHDRELESMGLSAPQMTYLIRALTERGIEADPGITTVEEAEDAILQLAFGSPEKRTAAR